MQNDYLKDKLYEFTDELLGAKQEVKIRVFGNSMFPLLRNGDTVVVERCEINKLKSGDIILFRARGKWIAHRLHKIKKKESKIIFKTKGDSCIKNDKPFGVAEFVGKVISYQRNAEMINIQRKYIDRIGKLIVLFSFVIAPLIHLWLIIMQNFKKMKKVFASLSFVGQKSKGLMTFSYVLSALQGILPLLIIYMIKWLIDKISHVNQFADKNDAFSAILFIVALIGFVFLTQSLVSIFLTERREKLGQSVSLFIHSLVHKKYASLDMAHLEDADQQDKLHRAIQEAAFRPMKMVSESQTLLQSVVSWVFIAALLYTVHWSVFPLILIAVVPGFVVRVIFSKKMYRMTKENSQKEREGYYYNRILTSNSFAKELRLFNLEKFFSLRFENIQKDLHGKKNKIIRSRSIADIWAQTFAVALIFVSFGFVSYLAIYGTLTVGTVILFFLLFQRGFTIMKDMFQSFAGLIEDQVFFNDFYDFLELKTTQNESSKQTAFPKDIETGIFVKNVSFQYPSSTRKALKNVTVEIPKGKTVALVGANGSGKTTLVKLLCGFYKPDEGSIFMDNNNISELNPLDIRMQISAVFQDFALYNLTAAENILMGKISGTASESEIRKAAESAGIADVIEKFPQGYHTMLGNLFAKGEELSIGQWQKMAIAKAFYRDAPILFMDEPSSALDAETELQLLQKLKTLAKDKTVLIISHRFSTIKWADNIYVMENGEIIEGGNHEQLMAARGRYSQMYSINRED